ncbi:MAG: glycosyltransferase family 2 protein [Acidimicrobiia bacterium]|nr:glycosyltransferase family 2 protein [Acidimicrobiia bacterium]
MAESNLPKSHLSIGAGRHPVQPRRVSLSVLPFVSVVMAVRDEAAYIEATLRAIFDQDYAGDLEVVVADGGSTDGTLDILEEWASKERRLTVINNPEGVVGAGLNRAIEMSTGEVLVRCDGHAELPLDYVGRAVRTLRQTGVANVGGRQLPVGNSPVQKAIAAAMGYQMVVGNARFRRSKRAGPADTVYLGVFEREALDRVGGFDPGLVRNQDYELNHRLRKAGEVVWFDPGLSVNYRPRSGLRALWRQYLDYGRWKRKMLAGNPGALAIRQLAAPALTLGLAGSIIGGLAGRAGWWILPALYGALVVGITLTELIKRPDPAALLLPAVIPIIHLGWGIGFLFLPVRRRRTLPEEGPG